MKHIDGEKQRVWKYGKSSDPRGSRLTIELPLSGTTAPQSVPKQLLFPFPLLGEEAASYHFWVLIPDLTIACGVALSELLSLSEGPLSRYENGIQAIPMFKWVEGHNEVIHIKATDPWKML